MQFSPNRKKPWISVRKIFIAFQSEEKFVQINLPQNFTQFSDRRKCVFFFFFTQKMNFMALAYISWKTFHCNVNYFRIVLAAISMISFTISKNRELETNKIRCTAAIVKTIANIACEDNNNFQWCHGYNFFGLNSCL